MDRIALSVYLRYCELLNKKTDFPEECYQGDYIYDIAQILVDKYAEQLLDDKENELFKDTAEQYIFNDINNGSDSMFSYEESQFTVDPYESIELTFFMNDNDIVSTDIELSIFPLHHNYNRKDLIFSVIYNNLIGDLDHNGEINVLDLIACVILILDDNYDSIVDFNNDGVLNVLDAIILIDLILS